jgi:hypothetical protein
MEVVALPSPLVHNPADGRSVGVDSKPGIADRPDEVTCMSFVRLLPLLLVLTIFAAPALAQDSASSADGTSPWGLRVGLGSDPDQLIGGVNFLETKIADNVFLWPNAELGVGDDYLILSGTAPFFYRFETSTGLRPYAGGGVSIGIVRFDGPRESDTSTEIALQLTGGVIFQLKGGTEMFGELNLSSGDLRDISAMIGWRF